MSACTSGLLQVGGAVVAEEQLVQVRRPREQVHGVERRDRAQHRRHRPGDGQPQVPWVRPRRGLHRVDPVERARVHVVVEGELDGARGVAAQTLDGVRDDDAALADDRQADFAVFENAISATFLELAFVEVSSDGVNFFRFPNASLTASAVGAFGSVDPTNISGLAGKYQTGFGTPFDLAALADSPLLDKQRVGFVRIVDIIGSGTTKDSDNRPIYDPTPTIGSGGFDLEAIGAIHVNSGDFRMIRFALAESTAELEWESNPGSSYRLEHSGDLDEWLPLETVAGTVNRGRTVRSVAVPGGSGHFWRVVRTGG